MAISRFSKWRIFAIVNFRECNDGFFEKPIYEKQEVKVI